MRVIIIALVIGLALPAHAAMYKWVDAQGRTQYSDTPPPPGVKKVEEHKIVRNTIDTSGAPFAVQDAAKKNPVTLWISDCGDLCTRARDYLAKRGVPYSVRNPSRQGEQDAWKKASGGDNSIPLLVIGAARTVKGFDESDWSAALDAAGYPRSAPSIKPQAIPAADAAPAGKPAPQGTPQAQAPAEEKK
jgi:hypothetical protein